MSESKRIEKIQLDLDENLLRLGDSISGLSRPTPPAGLAARTMAHIQANLKPAKRVFWLLQPITNPVARVAAAAAIVAMLFPLTDFETGATLGRGIENRLGARVTDSIESMVDNVLVQTTGPGVYSQTYLDSFMGVNRPKDRPKVKRVAMKETEPRVKK
jgi:hypothetical protein